MTRVTKPQNEYYEGLRYKSQTRKYKTKMNDSKFETESHLKLNDISTKISFLHHMHSTNIINNFLNKK